MLKKPTILIFVFLLAFALATNRAEAATNSAKGKLYLINTRTNILTVKIPDGKLKTVKITPTTILLRNGKRISLHALVLGDRISILYLGDAVTAAKVAAIGPKFSTIQGVVKHVDSRMGIVQVGARKIKTDSHIRISRNGKVASLNSLTMLDHIVAHVRPQLGNAAGVCDGECDNNDESNNGGPDPDEMNSEDEGDIEAEGPDESEASGNISALHLTSKTVTVKGQGVGEKAVTIKVTPQTEIEVGRSAAKVNNLAVGLFLQSAFSPATMQAYRIAADQQGESLEIEGSITAINVPASTITIQGSDGSSVTVNVDASTEFEHNGVSAFFTDLQVGDTTGVEYNSSTMLANQVSADSPGSGDNTAR